MDQPLLEPGAGGTGTRGRPTPTPWASLPPAARRAAEDDGTRPHVVLGGTVTPLTRDDRPDPAALGALHEALAGGQAVEFQLEGLFNLASTYVGRVVGSLLDVLVRDGAAGPAATLFDALLALDPGVDSFRCASWRSALLAAAGPFVTGDLEAAEYARKIAARARALGVGECQPHKLIADLLRAHKARNSLPFVPPAAAGSPPPHPSAKYADPLAYLVGEFKDRLWHDGSGNGYLSAGNHHLRVGSAAFENWLRGGWFDGHLGAVKDDDYTRAAKTVAALAGKAPAHTIHTRVARHDGAIYVDLANDAHEVVRIGPDGWEVTTDAPVKFVRGPDAAPLPLPESGGTLDDLRGFVNLTDAGFRTYAAALFDALKGYGDYQVVVTRGEQGAGKTTLSRLAVRLIDPRKLRDPADTSDIPGPPKDEGDLAATACNYLLVAFDNVSKVTDEMSDAYCRVATGGGVTKRKLYSDGDLARLSYCGPLWLNGIPDVVKKGDLADRVTFLDARRVAAPRPVRQILTDFDAARPRILGALYGALAAGLRSQAGGLPAGVDLPRMAASGEWVYHCFTALGWDYRAWRRGVATGQEGVAEDILEGSDVGKAVLGWWRSAANQGVAHRNSPERWRSLFLLRCPEDRRPFFPAQPNTFAGQLRQLAPALRKAGVEVTFPQADDKGRLDDGSRGRVIVFAAVAENTPTDGYVI